MTGQNSQRGRDREAISRSVSCSSRKFGYISRRTAKDAAHHARNAGPMRPYRCSECGLWHIGHKPKAVIRGEISSEEWYETKARRDRQRVGRVRPRTPRPDAPSP